MRMRKYDPRKTTILHQIQTILERQLNSQRLRESSTIKRPRSPRHLTSLAVGDCRRGRLISNTARLKRQSLTEPLQSRLRSVPVLQLIENKLALLVDGFSVHGAFNSLDASDSDFKDDKTHHRDNSSPPIYTSLLRHLRR